MAYLTVLFLFYMYVQCTVYLNMYSVFKQVKLKQLLGIYYGDLCVIVIGRVELLSLLLLFFYYFIFSLLTEHQTD